jgi:hypothetical protein
MFQLIFLYLDDVTLADYPEVVLSDFNAQLHHTI